MIKYVSVPEKNMTLAILNNTEMDAIHKISKMCDKAFGDNMYAGCCYSKYKMPQKFVATVFVQAGDTWDEQTGKDMAKKKVLRNYYRSMDKRLAMFKKDLADCTQRYMENN